MSRKSGSGGRARDRLVVGLVGATFVAVGLLLAQAFMTARSHERMIEATLGDFAAFAAEGIATELNSSFSAIFLDRIGAERASHEAWIGGSAEAGPPEAAVSLPEGAITHNFSIHEGTVIARAEPLGDLEGWLLDVVVPYARDVYPTPAPYVVIRDERIGAARAAVFRREGAGGAESIYGFFVDFSALRPLYRRALAVATTLPRSLSSELRREDLLSVRLLFPQDETTLHRLAGPAGYDLVRAEAFAAKAGRMLVRVDLDRARAAPLLAGGMGGPNLSILLVLSALTAGLLVVAFVVLRRAAHLSRLREDFVANVSHDLRTPLSQIRMFSETLLLDRIAAPEERRRALSIIRRQAMGLTDLVNNILHASRRVEGGIQPTRVDLPGVLAEVEDALGPLASDQAVRILSSVRGDPTAVVDPGVLRRVLTNLLDNAIKYGPAGHHVTVTLRNDGHLLGVIVEDEGEGIPPRERERIWERFTRLETGDPAGTGTGLGLAVVRDLAIRHGGGVSLTNAPHGGSRFEVTLALAGEPGA